MSKKYSQSKSPAKGVIAALISFGALALGYSAIFPLYKFGNYVFMTAVCGVGAYIAYVMGSGLDTSRQAGGREELAETGNQELDAFIKKGMGMIESIRAENDKIPDDAVSAQIEEIERVSMKIFKAVIEKPKKLSQLRRFMEYYLPTTLKILSSYSRIDTVSSQSTEQAKAKIETSLNLVITAFNKQLDKLYHDDFLDVSTDIEVLETVFKKDDLIENNRPLSAKGAQATMTKEEQ